MKFLRNNWVITLTATLVGVFAALYLNELDATKKIKNQKAIAKENILAEIQSNGEKMKVAVQKHIEFREIIMFMNSYSDEETDDLIVPLDSMNHFRKNHPNTILVRDSIELNKGIYKYEDGQINFDFSTPQYELTTIAWKTLKNSGISSSFDFECLMFLEGLYNITEKVLEKMKSFWMKFYWICSSMKIKVKL